MLVLRFLSVFIFVRLEFRIIADIAIVLNYRISFRFEERSVMWGDSVLDICSCDLICERILISVLVI